MNDRADDKQQKARDPRDRPKQRELPINDRSMKRQDIETH